MTLPNPQSAIEVSFESPIFDTRSHQQVRDAFEVLIENAAGQALAMPFLFRRDASYNWSEGLNAVAGVGTNTSTADSIITASFNLNGIATGTRVNVIARLLNNDSDTESSVVIRRVRVVDNPTPAPISMPIIESASIANGALDPQLLIDVTGLLEPIYGRTSLVANSNALVTDVQLTKRAASAIGGQLLLVIDNLSDPSVNVLQPDGYLSGGRPFLKLNSADSADWLVSGGSTMSRELRFQNPNGVQFTYQLTALAEVNSSPTEFTTTPSGQVNAGDVYDTVVQARDPDAQALIYSLITAPPTMMIDRDTGVIRWPTTGEDIGNHVVIVRATDPFGLNVTQTFAVEVIDSLPNRPPMFTTAPVTEARVAGTFEVTTFNVGNQPVGIAAGKFDGQSFALATVNAGDSNLTVGQSTVSVGEPKPSDLFFRSGQDVDLGFPAFEHPNDLNVMEGFVQTDLNNDGMPDFVTSGLFRQVTDSTNSLTHLFSVVLGDGEGGFHAPTLQSLPIPNQAEDHFRSLQAGDFNGDGHIDVIGTYMHDTATSGPNAPKLILLPGNGDGTFGSPSTTDLAGQRLDRFQVADVNADGRSDLLTIYSNWHRAGVMLGNGDGTFQINVEFFNGTAAGTLLYYGAAIGDLNGANGPDIVLPIGNCKSYMCTQTTVKVVLHTHTTLDSRRPYYPFSGVGLTSPQTTWVLDADGDGHSDILYTAADTGNSNNGGLGLYKGTGDGTSFVYQDAVRGFQYRPFNSNPELIDFNGDGRQDVLLGGGQDTENFSLSVALSNGMVRSAPTSICCPKPSESSPAEAFTVTIPYSRVTTTAMDCWMWLWLMRVGSMSLREPPSCSRILLAS